MTVKEAKKELEKYPDDAVCELYTYGPWSEKYKKKWLKEYEKRFHTKSSDK